MPEEWFKEIENSLEDLLNEFLRANPYQDFLVKNQDHQDQYQSLSTHRQDLQAKAEEKRKNLLAVVISLKDWKARSKRAKQARAFDLAKRADEYLDQLMGQGRKLWAELDELGNDFREIERQISSLAKKVASNEIGLEKKWAEFEEELELDQIKQNNQIKD